MKLFIISICVVASVLSVESNHAQGHNSSPAHFSRGGAYSGRGAYSGLGLSGPFRERPTGLRDGIKCLNIELKMIEQINQTLMECHNKVFDSWEQEGHAAAGHTIDHGRSICGIVCTGQNLGLFDENGKPVKQKMQDHIEAVYPTEVIPMLSQAIDECINKHGDEIALKENDCSSFRMMAACLKSNARKVCHGPRMEKKSNGI